MTDINKADIVERMRSIDPTWDVWDAKGMTLLKECGLWCHEAADEIERLRSEVAWHEEENHRLRAALHKIAEWDLTGTAIAALREKE